MGCGCRVSALRSSPIVRFLEDADADARGEKVVDDDDGAGMERDGYWLVRAGTRVVRGHRRGLLACGINLSKDAQRRGSGDGWCIVAS